MNRTARQYPLLLPHQNAMGADDFMVTRSNEAAAQWIGKWPDWGVHCSVLHGTKGSGKTHLAHMWQIRSEAKNLAPQDLQKQSASELCVDAKNFVIDDADQIAGNPAAEEALFHLYNRVKEDSGFLLLTSVKAPAHWGIALPDLRSRLSSIPAIEIGAPDDDLLSALLIKQFRDRQIDIGMEVVTYLLPRIPRTPDAIRALVTALDRASLAEGRGISIALAKRLIEDESFILSP